MKSFKSIIEEALKPEGPMDPLIVIYNAGERAKRKMKDDPNGILGYALLSTMESIHGFTLDSTQLRKLKAGGTVLVADGHAKNKKLEIQLSPHSKFAK